LARLLKGSKDEDEEEEDEDPEEDDDEEEWEEVVSRAVRPLEEENIFVKKKMVKLFFTIFFILSDFL
jgi:hypothetical protein